MASIKNQPKIPAEEEATFLYAMSLSSAGTIPMVLKAAIELELLEIIAKAGPGAPLTSAEIASELPTSNPAAAEVLDRLLRFLAAHSVVTCTVAAGEDGRAVRRYGLAPVCRFLTRDHDGASVAARVLMSQEPALLDGWQQLKYAVLEGVIPFKKAHGMMLFEYHGVNPKLNKVFNEGMATNSTIIVKKILECYKGFEGVKELVDVGGGIGVTLNMIISKYPNIKGINFDLPHVIYDAPPIPGVEHIGGDMFVSIPSGDTIFMKEILHDWSDEQCLKILKNCWKVLPPGGKVIVIEGILPEIPETNNAEQSIMNDDIYMLTYTCGGKERTEVEFKSLAMEAGFSGFQVACCAFNKWVIELIM